MDPPSRRSCGSLGRKLSLARRRTELDRLMSLKKALDRSWRLGAAPCPIAKKEKLMIMVERCLRLVSYGEWNKVILARASELCLNDCLGLLQRWCFLFLSPVLLSTSTLQWHRQARVDNEIDRIICVGVLVQFPSVKMPDQLRDWCAPPVLRTQ